MEKSSIIVLAVLVIVSFSYAFFVYMSIANALDSKVMEFYSGYAESVSKMGMVGDNEEMAIVSSLCTINITRTETYKTYPEGNASYYLYERKSCDIAKMNSFMRKMKSKTDFSCFSLATAMAFEDMPKSIYSVLREKYPNEKTLLMEKVYDATGMMPGLVGETLSYESSLNNFMNCSSGNLSNMTFDPACVSSLIDAEIKSTPILQNQVNFDGFAAKCQKFYIKQQDNLNNVVPSMINIAEMCQRMEVIFTDTRPKILQSNDMETEHGKFLKAYFLYYLSHIDENTEDVKNEINTILKENIDSHYRDTVFKE